MAARCRGRTWGRSACRERFVEAPSAGFAPVERAYDCPASCRSLVAWGLWPTTYLPPAWRYALATLVLLLLIIPLSTWDELLKRVGLSRRLIHVPRPLAYGLIALAFLPLFWIARLVHTRWGDAYLLVHAIPHPEAKLTYSWQAPLDVFLHAKV